LIEPEGTGHIKWSVDNPAAATDYLGPKGVIWQRITTPVAEGIPKSGERIQTGMAQWAEVAIYGPTAAKGAGLGEQESLD